jgi:hypothetical protein
VTSRRAVAIAAALVAAALQAPAHADAVSADELAGLAQRAKTDPAALSELRRVDTVDGRRVDVASALDGASDAELVDRLDAIADGARAADPSDEPSSDAARENATDILSQRRFQPSELPRPFAGPLERLGDAISRGFDRVVAFLPGGEATFWVIVGLLTVALAAFVTARLGRRRRRITTGAERTDRSTRGAKPEDAKSLLAEADRAEASGDGRTAVRLRFRAGLLRLGGTGAIAFRPSITTGEVRRKLRSTDFEAVAASFEEIAYGDRPVTTGDLELSRRGWDAVLVRVAA